MKVGVRASGVSRLGVKDCSAWGCGSRKTRQPSREGISDSIKKLQAWLVAEPELCNRFNLVVHEKHRFGIQPAVAPAREKALRRSSPQPQNPQALSLSLSGTAPPPLQAS